MSSGEHHSLVNKLWRAEALPDFGDAYNRMQSLLSRTSSFAAFSPVSSTDEKWNRGLKNPARYKHMPIVYSVHDNGPSFGQPAGSRSIELRLADDDGADESDMDAVVIVQVAVPTAINYAPYDILLSHPAFDRDIPTMHGLRRGFMVIPASSSALPMQISKQSVYDGKAVLDTIAKNPEMCDILETLRYSIHNEDGEDTLIDILRPETLKSQLHVASDVENGRLRDTYRYVNELHPYIRLLREEASIKESVERPEADGGHNFALDRKVKVGKKEIDSKRGAGNDSSHLVPVGVIEHIEQWCDKNIYQKIKTADVRRRHMTITVSRLDGQPLDHHFENKEHAQDDGVRAMGSFVDTPFNERNSGLFLQLDMNVWPIPMPRIVEEEA